MKESGQIKKWESSIVLKFAVWILILSLLPLGALLVFISPDVTGGFKEVTASLEKDQARMLANHFSLLSTGNSSHELLVADGIENHFAFLVDEDGKYLDHSDKSKIAKSIYDDFANEYAAKMLAEKEGSFFCEKCHLVVGYYPVPGKRAIAVVAKNDVFISTIINRIHKSALIRLGASLLIVAFGAGLAIWLLTRPLSQLKDVAINVGKGNLETKLDLSEFDGEFKTLAEAFNQMTDDLRKLNDTIKKHAEGLEDEVKKRTNELTQKNMDLEKFNKMSVGRELKMVELKKRIIALEGKAKKR
jgi:methyl-accepting chemotaxis protein